MGIDLGKANRICRGLFMGKSFINGINGVFIWSGFSSQRGMVGLSSSQTCLMNLLIVPATFDSQKATRNISRGGTGEPRLYDSPKQHHKPSFKMVKVVAAEFCVKNTKTIENCLLTVGLPIENGDFLKQAVSFPEGKLQENWTPCYTRERTLRGIAISADLATVAFALPALPGRWGNAFYEKNMTDFVCECVPMMIFMLLGAHDKCAGRTEGLPGME